MLDSYLCMQEDLKKRTEVIHWSLFWEKKVLYHWRQSTRNLGQNCRKDVVRIRWERISNFPCYDSIVWRSTQMQKVMENRRYTIQLIWKRLRLSHICFFKPAQSFRSSRGDMWRVWIPSRKNGATRCDGTNKFFTRAQCDQDKSSFGLWWPSVNFFSIASFWRANWEAVTTRQIE